jgi:RHS repeat-associated protein
LTFNTETHTYNNLNQMTQLVITGTQPLNISYNFTAGQNNRKITSQTDNLSGETVTYQYDSLNRLITASSSQSWGETYGFDAFGNLLSKTGTGGAPTLSQSVNTATNQIVGQSYDANGNQLAGPLGGVNYDAENRIVSVSSAGVQYAYDSRNKRIWRSILSGGNLAQQVYVYGVDGQKIGTYTFTLAQYGQTNTPEMTNSTVLLATFFGHKRVGTYDRLGSAKYNQSNNAAQSFYPYGEDRGTVEPNDALKFATYTRDAATGLDYADQRYYASNFGRFMSPDRSTRGTDGSNPGTLNSYTYVLNDPVNRKDPSGLDYCLIDGNPTPGMNLSECEEAGGQWALGDPPGCDGTGSGFLPNGADPDPCQTPQQPAPAPQQPATPDCQVMVGYAPWVPNFPGSSLVPGKHTFLYVDDGSGWDVVDAGPTNNPPFIVVQVGGVPEVIWIGFGPMQTNVSPNGLYGENTNPASMVYWDEVEPCSLVTSLEQDARSLNDAVQYSAPQPGTNWYNSNSFVYTLVTWLGLLVPAPPVLAPGWGNGIPH